LGIGRPGGLGLESSNGEKACYKNLRSAGEERSEDSKMNAKNGSSVSFTLVFGRLVIKSSVDQIPLRPRLCGLVQRDFDGGVEGPGERGSGILCHGLPGIKTQWVVPEIMAGDQLV